MIRRGWTVLAVLLAGMAWAQPWAFVPASGQRVALAGLQSGATYQLRVSGWMSFGAWQANGRPLLNDACYEFNAKGYPDPLPVVNADVGIQLCGAYRDDHTYLSAPFVAPAAQITLWVFDTDYRDNGGSVLAEALLVAGAAGGGAGPYCILRNQDLYGPPVCYQFYLADTRRTSGAMAELIGGACAVTDLAARQGWEVDPLLGGPHPDWRTGDVAMASLSRYGGDLYGCLAASGTTDPFAGDDDPWEGRDPDGDSCPWAFDGECDEPGIGTGLCLAGTDTFDCQAVAFDPANSCPWAFDGECDEPGIGTGLCLAGTDAFDCQVAVPPPPYEPPYADPPDPERRPQTLNQCDVWSVASSGGFEGTVDTWDVSTIPDGAVFDMRFNAFDLPDRFRVAYRGATAFESGWRGSSTYQGNPAYPGGVAGPGSGEAPAMFPKAGVTSFTVTVVGGESGTEWEYSVRCRMP